jgi:hypothetical protein
MSRLELNSQAMVQPAESKAVLIVQAKDMYRNLVAVERTTLKRALDLGDTLRKLRRQCRTKGDWQPALEETTITKSRAYEYMTRAKVPAREELLTWPRKTRCGRPLRLAPKPTNLFPDSSKGNYV